MKITPREPGKGRDTVVIKSNKNQATIQGFAWWKAGSRKDLCEQLLATASFLKEQQQYRFRQAVVYARLYGNMPLMNVAGANLNRMSIGQNLPMDRPTMNVVQSCIDTLVSRITQSKPRPVFLTDNSDYKQRKLAKQFNNFISGELYQTKAQEMFPSILRDAAVIGTGCEHYYKTKENRVAVERVLNTELFVDPNDALYGEPRQLYRLKLVDRGVLASIFPDYKSDIMKAEQAFPDSSADSSKTASDQVMVVEGWHLPSSKDAGDGRHSIACTNGTIFDEDWTKESFPFTFLHYSPRLLGFWGQSLSEQLMGTQTEINNLLITISKSIHLVGVPRIFQEVGSKVLKAAHNNEIGSIITYSGIKPSYEVANCMPQEVYAQLERLIQFAYQQSGISALAATAQKPAGLNSGEAIRNYDDLQSDRFAALQKRCADYFVEKAYKILQMASEIAKDEGKYQTVFPSKNAAQEIELPKADLVDNTFVIQCFDSSSLPRELSGRIQKITEMMQAGIISVQEGRRMLDFPDIEQEEILANAPEERILKILDEIVEDGKYTPPDPQMNLELAEELTLKYYNLYGQLKLEESRMQDLRNFLDQIRAVKQTAMATQQDAGGGGGSPLAVPQAPPTSPMLPNAPQ